MLTKKNVYNKLNYFKVRLYIPLSSQYNMMKKIDETIYEFQCESCEYGWVQRVKAIRNDKGSIVKKEFKIPQNCSHCKSVNWNIKRT